LKGLLPLLVQYVTARYQPLPPAWILPPTFRSIKRECYGLGGFTTDLRPVTLPWRYRVSDQQSMLFLGWGPRNESVRPHRGAVSFQRHDLPADSGHFQIGYTVVIRYIGG
jgi:hypothetical protein